MSRAARWTMKHQQYEVTDDSGFLGLIDPSDYRSFVDNQWTLEQLVEHFESEMRAGHLLIWGTGREDIWRVEVSFAPSSLVGFREFTAPIRASGNHLLLTNYEALTMAAQFEDVRLPEPHNQDLLVPVTPGLYACRVVQRSDPEVSDPRPQTDFLVDLTPLKENVQVPSSIPWSDL